MTAGPSDIPIWVEVAGWVARLVEFIDNSDKLSLPRGLHQASIINDLRESGIANWSIEAQWVFGHNVPLDGTYLTPATMIDCLAAVIIAGSICRRRKLVLGRK
jgi:hypothetical protein